MASQTCYKPHKSIEAEKSQKLPSLGDALGPPKANAVQPGGKHVKLNDKMKNP